MRMMKMMVSMSRRSWARMSRCKLWRAWQMFVQQSPKYESQSKRCSLSSRLLFKSTGMTTFIHHYSFDNHCPPSLASHLLQTWPQTMAHPSWHCNPMELNLQHDALCTHVQESCWSGHSWQGSEVGEVWAWQQQLDYCWKYKKATVFFSQDGASVAAVIPAMDKIDNHLNPTMKKPYHPAIQAVMKLVCKKLNQYYSMTDLPLVYQIAMGN